MKQYRYTVIFEPAEEGGYVAHVPTLNGLATQGETLEEAREMVKEAITGYIEALRIKITAYKRWTGSASTRNRIPERLKPGSVSTSRRIRFTAW